MRLRLAILLLTVFYSSVKGQKYNTMEKVVIPPSDNRVVSITADLYKPLGTAKGGFLLFHQAGSSRGEYKETAQRLNRLGYVCLAVDLRSGKSMSGIENETYQDAKAKMKGTSYLDAYPDMLASLTFYDGLLKGINQGKELPIFVIGSSYSASLSCRLAAETQSAFIDALFIFSPGEYFGNLNGEDDYIADFLQKIEVPIWATSSQDEVERLEKLLTNVSDSVKLRQFKPSTSGQHGAKALWPQFVDSEDYWESMLSFLKGLN
ncbi:hypothetical protein GCM10027429_33900 [Marivirga atlantica]|jgi:dienelactone hydrolase|uniref:Serine aminopeptidase S33 domain-containing protein n=1 Tax=Marivirga atlantica TaxID=1548457 RepID=A0A937DL72_9BACT|nr:hypothetical protein [Marivirga atlantica]MBL0766971.1 hypothetical protein [Marivirga atlantica]